MKRDARVDALIVLACAFLLPAVAAAADVIIETTSEPIKVTIGTGVSGLWVLANASYAGMRAQGSTSGWRIVALLVGLPGSLVTVCAVKDGSGRAYGVDLPARSAK